MSTQACDDKNDKIIYINSEFRSSGTVSEYTIQLDKGVHNVEYVELIDTTVEYSDVVFRNGGVRFTVTRYNVENLNGVNTLVEDQSLSKVFHPYVHNIAKAVFDFNNYMFNNLSLLEMNVTAGPITDDYSYVRLDIQKDIMCNNDIVVITDQDNFLRNYFNIPYSQIIVANPSKIINGKPVSIMNFVKNITTTTPLPSNYIYYFKDTDTVLSLMSKEAFLYTKYSNPAIPYKDEQFSEPLHNRSIGMYLETINGINIDLVNTNGGIFNDCFYVHDNTRQRIRNIATTAMSIMGISSVARELPHIRFYFNTPTTINGFKVRLVYSDGTPYVVNEMNQTGKSTIVLKAHCSA